MMKVYCREATYRLKSLISLRLAGVDILVKGATDKFEKTLPKSLNYNN